MGPALKGVAEQPFTAPPVFLRSKVNPETGMRVTMAESGVVDFFIRSSCRRGPAGECSQRRRAPAEEFVTSVLNGTLAKERPRNDERNRIAHFAARIVVKTGSRLRDAKRKAARQAACVTLGAAHE